MNRLRTTAALAALVIILAACGPAASGESDEPSSEAPVAASEPQASQGGIEPSFGEGVVADLEALIPDTVGGVTMQKSSMQGNEFLVSPDSDPATIAFLQDLGVSPSDVSMAIGFGFSEDFSSSAVMFVFRAEGAESGRLVSAFKDATDADRDVPLEWSSTTIGGKQVEMALDGTQTIYLYVKGDTLIFLGTSDPATAEEVISGLP